MRQSNRIRTTHRGPVLPQAEGPPRLRYEERGPLVASPHKGSRESPDKNPGEASPPLDATETLGGVYVISVAARILDMHPQTLRKYERLGLVTPTRSMGMLRLYSVEDVVRVRLIKYMVDDLGMNLAGVEFALTLLNRVVDLRERIRAISQAKTLNLLVLQEMEEMLRELGSIFPDNPSRV